MGTDTHTGTVERETAKNLTTEVTGAGTVGTARTGTESTEGVNKETYSNLTDAQSGGDTEDETRNLTTTDNGTVTRDGSETVTDTFHSEGSSPLRTYQALITEEIMGRQGQAWNFTDIIISDVQQIIASRIWKRRNCIV